MLCKEIIAVYSGNHTRPTNTKHSVVDWKYSWYIKLPLGSKGLLYNSRTLSAVSYWPIFINTQRSPVRTIQKVYRMCQWRKRDLDGTRSDESTALQRFHRGSWLEKREKPDRVIWRRRLHHCIFLCYTLLLTLVYCLMIGMMMMMMMISTFHVLFQDGSPNKFS
jgi:hypothetical protein